MGTAIDSDFLRRLERLVASHSCELLDAAFRGSSLRLVIDHADGVTHEHCAGVSREASVLLDAEDFGPASGYVLEVSSPGLDRELYGARDYERFRGRRAQVTFTDAASGNRRTVRGLLEGLSAEASGVALILEDDSGTTMPLTIDRIHKARLLVEL
ncbi:MAG: ribosome maturation factor RimP [Acidobacteria bacterium]|nr:ribosome maturation factor RimP [Acidobacteriota bacterium]